VKKLKKILVIAAIALAVICFGGYKLYQHSVNSNAAPVISFDSDKVDMSAAASEEDLLKGVTAQDAEDGDVSDSLIVESFSQMIGDCNVKVTYAAFDSDNHVSKATRIVHFTDYKSPRFTLSKPLICKESEVDGIPMMVGATDMIDGSLNSRVKVTAVDGTAVNKVGEHTMEFRVTNSLGDTVYLPVKLEVVSGSVNGAQITLKEYLAYAAKGSEFDASSYVVSYMRNDELVEGAKGLSISSNVDTSTPGTYEVTYKYGYGNSASYTRLIVVVE